MKRRIQRRYGACEPCRASKTKCDGRLPCSACRSERKRQSPCVYSEKVRALQRVSAELRRRTDKPAVQPVITPTSFQDQRPRSIQESQFNRHSQNSYLSYEIEDNSRTGNQSGQVSLSADSAFRAYFHPISVCTAVDEFKKLKPTRGVTAQLINKCCGFDGVDQSVIHVKLQSGSESQQSRTDHDYVHPCDDKLMMNSVELEHIGAKLNLIEVSIKAGQLTRSWIDLASVVREVEILKVRWEQSCHSATEPQAALKGLWKRVLGLESQLGLLLGKPTSPIIIRGDRSKTDCDFSPLKDDSLDATRIDLYQHIQSVVALNTQPSIAAAPEQFLERARDILMHEPFSQVGLCTTDEHTPAARNLQLNTHLLFTVIYLRLAAMCDVYSPHGKGFSLDAWSGPSGLARRMHLHQPRQKMAYVRKMLRSAQFVVNTFMSLCSDRDGMEINNIIVNSYGVFVAATLIGIAKLRHEIEWKTTTELLQKLERVFSKLSSQEPSCPIFSIIVTRLQDFNLGREPRPTSKDKGHENTSGLHEKQTDTNMEAMHNEHDVSSDSEPGSLGQADINQPYYHSIAGDPNISSFASSQQQTSDEELYDSQGDELSFQQDTEGYYSSFGGVCPSQPQSTYYETERGPPCQAEIPSHLPSTHYEAHDSHCEVGANIAWSNLTPLDRQPVPAIPFAPQDGLNYSHTRRPLVPGDCFPRIDQPAQAVTMVQHVPPLTVATTSANRSSHPLSTSSEASPRYSQNVSRVRQASMQSSPHLAIESNGDCEAIVTDRNHSRQQPQSGVLIPKGNRDHLSFYSISHPQQNLWHTQPPQSQPEAYSANSQQQFIDSHLPAHYDYPYVYHDPAAHAMPVYHN